MDNFFSKLLEILTLPPQMMAQAAESLNAFTYNETLLYDYLGYMHNAMGTPLYTLFSTFAVIGIGAMLWSMIVKAVAWFMEIAPFV